MPLFTRRLLPLDLFDIPISKSPSPIHQKFFYNNSLSNMSAVRSIRIQNASSSLTYLVDGGMSVATVPKANSERPGEVEISIMQTTYSVKNEQGGAVVATIEVRSDGTVTVSPRKAEPKAPISIITQLY